MDFLVKCISGFMKTGVCARLYECPRLEKMMTIFDKTYTWSSYVFMVHTAKDRWSHRITDYIYMTEIPMFLTDVRP
jgi:hypothetical protein